MNGKSKGPNPPMETGGYKFTKDGSGALDKETQAKIGQQLRAMYDEVVRQGVPDRFADLLNRLEHQEQGGAAPEAPKHTDRREDGER
jgi:hypothetical protein